jgi:hypothetical protein
MTVTFFTENNMSIFKRTVATFTTVCMLGLSVPAFATSAPIISTEEIASAAQTQQIKDQVRSALDRAEVQQALQSNCVAVWMRSPMLRPRKSPST